MNVQRRTLLDHAATWLAAVFVGLYGLAYFVALATPEPPGTIRDGFGAVVIWPAIGSLYGAAAIVQQEYNLVHGWRPSWRQGITLSWVGGWALLIALGVIGSFVSRGVSAAFESLGFRTPVLGPLCWSALGHREGQTQRLSSQRPRIPRPIAAVPATREWWPAAHLCSFDRPLI